jgi:hypothetical protein
MHKKKGTKILDIVKNVGINVTLPETTSSLQPLRIDVAGISTDSTEIGIAQVEGKNAIYLRVRLRAGE